MSWHVCRICLAGDTKTYTIINTQFQDIYERLTAYKWARDDRPVKICYICKFQLQRSLKFQQMSKKSEETFDEILAAGFEFTEEILPILYKRSLQTVQIGHVTTVNIEPKEAAEIKEEIKETGERQLKRFSVSPIITACAGNEECSSINKKQKLGNSQMENNTFFYVHDENNDNDADEIKIIDDYSNTQGSPEKILKRNTEENSSRIDYIKTDFQKNYPSVNGFPTHFLFNKKAFVYIPTPVNTDFSSSENDTSKREHKTKNISPNNEYKILTKESNTLSSAANKNTIRKGLTLIFKENDIITPRKNLERKGIQKNVTQESSKSNGKVEVPSDEDCKKSFTKKGQFLEKFMESKTENTFTCNTCNRSFNLKNKIILHMKIHNGNGQFICDKCPKTFTCLTYLNKHKLCHSPKKPFICQICKRSFHRRTTLSQHTRTHTGERPFSCKVCNKQFIQLCHLKQHNRVHSGEKPYSCICGKRFSQMGALLNHRRTHLMVKPFRCDICAHRFTQKNNLNIHIKRIHNLSLSASK